MNALYVAIDFESILDVHVSVILKTVILQSVVQSLNVFWFDLVYCKKHTFHETKWIASKKCTSRVRF